MTKCVLGQAAKFLFLFIYLIVFLLLRIAFAFAYFSHLLQFNMSRLIKFNLTFNKWRLLAIYYAIERRPASLKISRNI